MKTSLLSIGMLLGMLQAVLAGGNTSVVKLDAVTAITIDEAKITIKGNGMLVKRVTSDAAHGDSSVFGRPAQLLHAEVTTDAVFEIVPYFLRSNGDGVGRGVESDEAGKALSAKWWAGTLETARAIKVGDAVTIGYQSEKMTLTGFRVTHIVGAGSLTVQKPAEGK